MKPYVLPGKHPGTQSAIQAVWCAAVRITWAIITVAVVQTIVCGVALLPVVFLWFQLARWAPSDTVHRLIVISLAIIPSYVLFAVQLMLVSALAVRTLKWHTPAGLDTRVWDMEWPLLHWVRSMVATHVVRVIAGTLFRGSPVWTAYLRLAGARLGRRVYINSLAVTDYNLLEFGDDVVIGDGVHLSGHTVERGVLKTGAVRLGRSVTIGVGSFIGVGVVAGDGCQVGAMSFVPKHARLDPASVYIGVPAQKCGNRSPRETGLPITCAR
jgi:acetyltransferase-like isoleucine patch superfamily enzyme